MTKIHIIYGDGAIIKFWDKIYTPETESVTFSVKLIINYAQEEMSFRHNDDHLRDLYPEV